MTAQTFDQNRSLYTLGVLALAALGIGLVYWWVNSIGGGIMATEDRDAAIRAEVAEVLNSSSVPASASEMNQVAAALQKSGARPSDAERAQVAAQLKSGNNQ
jgi:hypothetical protein